MHEYTIFPFLPVELRRRHQAFSREAIRRISLQVQGFAPSPMPPNLRPNPDMFSAAATTAATECDRLLQILSPRAAITQWLDMDATTHAALTDTGFLARARWVLAATATGTSLDPAQVNDFFGQATCWWTAAYLADVYRNPPADDPQLAFSVDAMPGRQFLTRTCWMTIRYHWACKMIATQIAREVRADPEFAERLPQFTVANVDRVFDAVRRHSAGAPPIAADDSKGMELAALMAVGAGELSGLPFAEAATSHRMELHPWVGFADGLLACAPWHVLFALERPLLAAAEARLSINKKEKIDKGELFERAARSCILAAIGNGRPTTPHRCDIKIDPTTTPRDVDIALIGHTVQMLGEVKAMEDPESRTAPASSFETQVGKVYKQLHLRLCALDSGIPLIDVDGGHHHGADAIGLGVVLHPYNSSRDPRMLTYATGAADTTRIAVADLHSWVLLLHGLDGINDLRRYLQFRDDLRNIEALSIDESDTALAYFSPFGDRELARHQQRYAHRDPSLPVIAPMTPSTVDTETALQTKAPKDRRKWRRKFSHDCKPSQWM